MGKPLKTDMPTKIKALYNSICNPDVKQYKYSAFTKEMTFKEVLEMQQIERDRKPTDPYRILSLNYNAFTGIAEIKDQTLIK